MTTPVVLNKVRETSTVTGSTNDINLLGATGGYLPFLNFLVDGDKLFYMIDDFSGNWESGIGVYNEFTNTINRYRVISSSNNDQAVNFPSGTKTVMSILDGKIIQQLLELVPSPYW